MKDRRKPWQKAMRNKEFRFSRCGSMLQSTERAHKSANARRGVQAEMDRKHNVSQEIDRYRKALGITGQEACDRINRQRQMLEPGFRVHSYAIAAE